MAFFAKQGAVTEGSMAEGCILDATNEPTAIQGTPLPQAPTWGTSGWHPPPMHLQAWHQVSKHLVRRLNTLSSPTPPYIKELRFERVTHLVCLLVSFGVQLCSSTGAPALQRLQWMQSHSPDREQLSLIYTQPRALR